MYKTYTLYKVILTKPTLLETHPKSNESKQLFTQIHHHAHSFSFDPTTSGQQQGLGGELAGSSESQRAASK